jgi:hypothetical protein
MMSAVMAAMDVETDEARWLTYGELAEIRGISVRSATRMAFRHKWRRQAANDGTARVLVPLSALHDKSHGSDMASLISAFEATTAAMREMANQAGIRADMAEKRAEIAEKRADEAEQGWEAERSRAEAIFSRFAAMQAEHAGDRARAELIQAAFDQADTARREAEKALQGRVSDDTPRRARGIVARLRAAWRAE